MVPATLAYVFLGSTAGGLASAQDQPTTTTTTTAATREARRVRIVLYVVGAASLVLAVGLLSAHARRELRRLAPAVVEGEEGGQEGDEDEELGGGR
jgi:hypothetical protein